MPSPATPTALSDDQVLAALLAWCAPFVGPCEVASGDTRFHGRSHVLQLETSSGRCFLKVHGQRASWETEVHGYEQWARAFGDAAPRLLGMRDEEPLALLTSELPGTLMKDVQLPGPQELLAWRTAGRALAVLHDLAIGEHFGPCDRAGNSLGTPISDASAYVLAELDRWTADGLRANCLTASEMHIIQAARTLAPAFEGERPIPCHRDYCPYNWLVTSDGAWAGVIDFEFAYWDVRVADFTRYPGWEWLTRPDLIDALFEGYGRALTPTEEQQRLMAHVQYAVAAIVWGCENSFHGFAAEGREALRRLARLLA